jgi:hypothetical protein
MNILKTVVLTSLALAVLSVTLSAAALMFAGVALYAMASRLAAAARRVVFGHRGARS